MPLIVWVNVYQEKKQMFYLTVLEFITKTVVRLKSPGQTVSALESTLFAGVKGEYLHTC